MFGQCLVLFSQLSSVAPSEICTHIILVFEVLTAVIMKSTILLGYNAV
jgi:hypothetical protein